jgi:hypothetical protein
MTLDSKRAEAMEDDMMGVGSTLAKHGVAENDEDAQAPLIEDAKILAVKSCICDFGPPPST